MLRPLARPDVSAIAGFGLDPDNVRWGDVPAGYREDAASERIAQAEADRQAGRAVVFALVQTDDGAVVGDIDLRFPLPSVGELGYVLVPSARHRGLMARALRLAIRWAFTECALVRLQAFVSPDNEASARLLERLGFTREGVLRSYRGPGRDRVAYSLLPDELSGW